MATSDPAQPASMLEGTFDLHGKSCNVTLTSEAISWRQQKGKDDVLLPIHEILSVTTSTEKVKRPEDCQLQLVYIKHKKSHHLGRATFSLTTDVDTCTRWAKSIQEQIDQVSTRPRNTLVLVNPISGSKKGPQTYKDKVAPVFKEASMKTDVIVTDSAGHVKEIMDGYDLASIDSLVVVGGDGMYHLVADALTQRLMREAGLDLHNAENDIPDVTLPIGIIPCGTGNGIAVNCFGCYDVETAALGIVRGGRNKFNLHGIWSGGRFLVYSSLLQGCGVMADLIYDTAARRSMGRWRYPVVIGKYLTKGSARVLDVSIEYKQPNVPQSTSGTPGQDGAETTDSNLQGTYSQPWQTYQGQAVMLSVFLSDGIGYRETKNPANLRHSRLYITKQWSRAGYFKFFWRLLKFDPAMLHDPSIDHMPFVEYKVKINNPEEQAGHEKLLNIDGEVFTLHQPDYHVKIYPKKMNLFASVTEEFLLGEL